MVDLISGFLERAYNDTPQFVVIFLPILFGVLATLVSCFKSYYTDGKLADDADDFLLGIDVALVSLVLLIIWPAVLVLSVILLTIAFLVYGVKYIAVGLRNKKLERIAREPIQIAYRKYPTTQQQKDPYLIQAEQEVEKVLTWQDLGNRVK